MPVIESPKGLAMKLGFQLKNLTTIANNTHKFYYSYPKTTRKKDGTIKTRTIEPVNEPLKTIQRRISRRVLFDLPISDCAHGCIKSRDSITNALAHRGRNYHFCTDIKKFYPSVRYQMVNEMFLSLGFSPPVATLLRRLVTHNGRLPQGSPTSSDIANLVFYPIDEEIVALIGSKNILYTRYLDDLVFSAQHCFKELTPALLEVFEQRGFRRSQRKTFYKQGPTEITGVLVRQNAIELTDEKELKRISKNLTPAQRLGFDNYITQVYKQNKSNKKSRRKKYSKQR